MSQTPPDEKHLVPEKLKAKRVLVVSESLGPINGVTRATMHFLEYLIEHKVRVAAVAPEFTTPDPVALRTRIPLIRLNGLPLVYNPDLRIGYPFRLSKIFYRTFRPDVIYLASPATLGWQVWWQLRKNPVPIVANFQTDLAAYSRRMLPGWAGKGAGWLLDKLTARFYGSPLVKTALVPSSSSRDYLLKLGVSKAKIKLVGRGVDGQLFDRKKRSQEVRARLAPQEEVLLLCVSRLSYEKGFDFLAEAYAQIGKLAQERGTTQKFRLVITGGNTNQHIEKDIRGYFEERGLDVVFTGSLSGEALAQTFASADLFVFPSVTETFGQAVQEALASGLPVVARAEGGPIDIIQDGVTGYLSDPLLVEEFAERSLKLIEDPELRLAMSRAAYAYARERSWDAINWQISQTLAEAL